MCENCGGVVHGAIGLGKAAINKIGANVDVAPDDVISFRRDICRNCDYAKRKNERKDRVKDGKPTNGLTWYTQCNICNCFLGPKTSLASEECPLKKWGTVKPI